MEEINSSSGRSDPAKAEETVSHRQKNNVKEAGTPASAQQLCTPTAARSKVTRTVSERQLLRATHVNDKMSQLTRAARTASLIPRTRVPCSHRPREKIKESAGCR